MIMLSSRFRLYKVKQPHHSLACSFSTIGLVHSLCLVKPNVTACGNGYTVFVCETLHCNVIVCVNGAESVMERWCRSAWQVQSNVIVCVNGAFRVLTATVPAVDTARPPLPELCPKLRVAPAIHQSVRILFNYWLFWSTTGGNHWNIPRWTQGYSFCNMQGNQTTCFFMERMSSVPIAEVVILGHI